VSGAGTGAADSAGASGEGTEAAQALRDGGGAAGPPEHELLALPGLGGVASAIVRGELVLHPSRETYLSVVEALRDAGFPLCSDLCAVDYLEQPSRQLPDGVAAERFEVVVSLTSLERAERVRLRVQVGGEPPRLPSLFGLYPGTEAMEREAYDMFGVLFDDHPDLSRILMPDDWEGYPLRKDYSVGRVPVQFKEAPGPR
jgi:NADH-quinone oxidoreductase subunit C